MTRAQVGNALSLYVLLVFALGAGVPVSAKEEPSSELSPQELVREAAQNEIAANTATPTHFMFKDQRTTLHLSQTKLVVETRDAAAGILIAQNGHPLDEQQRKTEEGRLENYIRNPDELNHKRKQEKEDADRTERIMRALPDAFLYEADGTEKGSARVGRAGNDLLRLKFRPNPAYNPPTRVEQVLTGMAGHVLIDPKEKRIAEIDGTLQKEVGFGWGILGHLDRGGHFLVQQADVVDHDWDITRMDLAFTGKILLIKKLHIQSTDIFFDFYVVPPDLTFAQGVELLKKQAAQSQAAGAVGPQPREPHSNQGKEDQGQLCCDR